MAFGPSISTRVVDNNDTTISLTGDETKLIKYYSHAAVNMGVHSQSGAAINEDTYIIRNGDKTIYGYVGVFPNVTDPVFTFSAEDEFGNVGRATHTASMVDYEPITCQISNNKPNGSGEMTVECSGTWFNGSFGAANNMLTVLYRYVEAGQNIENAIWTMMAVYKSGNSYAASANLTGLDYQKIYIFEVKAYDLLSEARSSNYGVKGAPVFHWSNDDVIFEVPVTFNAGASGAMPDLPDLKFGEWFPELDPDGVSYYTTRKGWYSKIGNVVTVGFFIKAMCNIYDVNLIRIFTLPFTPAQASAGGGMCSGAKISEHKNFQCFVAETSGMITTRVQDCNNENAQNISTSASGCYFPINAGEVALSGTITYLTY